MPISNQPSHFDLPENWSRETWQKGIADQARARLVTVSLPDSVRSVLDVGCGNGVYANLDEPNRFKVGVDLSKVALMYVIAPHLQANAVRLPFSDASFDATVCMELLEHLPLTDYGLCLNELQRVSRQFILITVPFNENLSYSQITCPNCGHKFHIYRHIRSFTRNALQQLFGERITLLSVQPIIPIKQKILPGIWNLYRFYMHRKGYNFPSGALCPQCGYRSNRVSTNLRSSSPSAIRHFAGNLWPRVNRFTWWMAIYQKSM